MQQTPIKSPTIDVNRTTVTKWVIIGLLVVVAFVALMFSRRLIQPLDNLLTQQQCSTYGREELSRQTVDREASNRFSLIDRTEGHCVFGPIVEFDEDGEVIEPDASDGEAATSEEVTAEEARGEPADATDEAVDEVPQETIQVSLADIETSGFYRGMKWLFIAVQLGAASAAVRIAADPLLDRFVRRPRSSSARAPD